MGLLFTKNVTINRSADNSGALNNNAEATRENAEALRELSSSMLNHGKSIDGLSRAISDEKIELDNELYSDLKNKEVMLGEITDFINSYFSYVFYCLSGDSPFRSDSPTYYPVKHGGVYDMYPLEKTRDKYLKELDLYVKVNLDGGYLTLFEQESGIVEFEAPEPLVLSKGVTVISNEEFSRLKDLEGELVNKSELLYNIEKFSYNIFRLLIEAKMKTEFYSGYNPGEVFLSKRTAFVNFRRTENSHQKMDILRSYLTEEFISALCMMFDGDSWCRQESKVKDRVLDIRNYEGNKSSNKGFKKDKEVHIILNTGNKKFRGFNIPQYFEIINR